MYKFFSWIVVLFWMVFIFNLSSQVAERSNRLSTVITKVVVKTAEKVVPKAEFDIKSLNKKLRKNAHFFAYLVLGILVLNAFRRSGVTGALSLTLALAICVLYAISDEAHQLFVPGRGGQVRDIIIDSAGAGFGIGVCWVWNLRLRNLRGHHN